MNRKIFFAAFAVVSLLLCAVSMARTVVFQAAGPSATSILSTIAAYRDALGPLNAINSTPGAFPGRREINWDGGGANTSTDPTVTPFNVFLNTRGAQFTTPGAGLTQAPPSNGTQGGLATLFTNPTYGTIFRTFSAFRLFVPVGSNVTDCFFFVPGSNGATPATVTGFGAVFTDVDQDGRHGSTVIEFFDANEQLLFSRFVPASPGDGNFSFLGIVLDQPLIAHVQIITGNVALGPNDSVKTNVVAMDDFIYGEPQEISH